MGLVASGLLSLLGVPNVTSPPGNGASVSGTGFTVNYTLPPTCHYAVVQLRSSKTTPLASPAAPGSMHTEVLDWRVVVPFDSTQTRFFQFPSVVPQVLASDPTRTWTLTITAARIDSGLLLHPAVTREELYDRVVANWVGMQEVFREARAFSSATFAITLN